MMLGSAPAKAVMTSFWSIADNTARRTAGLSNGGCRWLKRKQPISPVRSLTATSSRLSLFSCGTRSIGGVSHQSISPCCKAAAAEPGVGRKFHTTRRQHRPAHRRLVERRMQMDEAQTADLASAVLDRHDQSLVALQLRHQVDRRVLPPIALALLQGRCRGARVGHKIPHRPLEIDDL